MKKRIIIVSGVVVLIFLLGIFLINNRVQNNKGSSEDLPSGVLIESNEKNVLDLANYSENITITASGSYIIQGSFTNSVIIDAPGKVQLLFNNVEIFSKKTAAIINKSYNPLEIALIQSTTNQISGGSNLKYRSAIYSIGEVAISGESGGLIVYSRLSNNSPIFSEEKININSGVVVLSGKDKILQDNIELFENKVNFEFKKEIKTKTQVVILNHEGDIVSQFESKGSFSKMTLIANHIEKEKKYFVYGDEELLVLGVGE